MTTKPIKADDGLHELQTDWIKKAGGAQFPTARPAATVTPLSKPAEPKAKLNKVRGRRNTVAKREAGEIVQLNIWVEPEMKRDWKVECARRGVDGGALLAELWRSYQATK